jgi:hypothetical protein
MYKVKEYCGIILIRGGQCSYSPFAYRPSPGQRPRLIFSSLLCLMRVSPAAPMCGPSSLHHFRGLDDRYIVAFPLSLSLKVLSEGLSCGVGGWFT